MIKYSKSKFGAVIGIVCICRIFVYPAFAEQKDMDLHPQLTSEQFLDELRQLSGFGDLRDVAFVSRVLHGQFTHHEDKLKIKNYEEPITRLVPVGQFPWRKPFFEYITGPNLGEGIDGRTEVARIFFDNLQLTVCVRYEDLYRWIGQSSTWLRGQPFDFLYAFATAQGSQGGKFIIVYFPDYGTSTCIQTLSLVETSSYSP